MLQFGRAPSTPPRIRSWASLTVVVALVGGLVAAAPMAAASAAPVMRAKPSAPKIPVTKSARVCATASSFSCGMLERTDITPLTASPNATPLGWGATNLQSAYNLPSLTAGGGQTVAVIEAYDNPLAESDLQVYRNQFLMPTCTTANGCLRTVNQDGQASPLPAADPNWAGEISLDVDQVSAVCPNCNILLVEANSAKASDLLAGVNAAVALGAKFVSLSFAGAEDPSDVSLDSQYLNHPGVVITAGTGSRGYGVSYPASSPDVVAVGGTSLYAAANTRGWAETAWSGSGSGCSSVEAAPSYQKGLANCSKRADSDISAVSDPTTGVAVYQTYGGVGWNVYGGTSVSSSIVAAAFALVGARPADDNPTADLYAHKSQLTDVTIGANGTCSSASRCEAGKGWDGPTGLGTPRGIVALQPAGVTASTIMITDPGAQSTFVGTAVSLTVHATDSAKSTLTYAAANLPAGLTIDAASGVISGKPTAIGQTTVNLTVTDAKGATATSAFSWTVTNIAVTVPTPPTTSTPGTGSSPTHAPNPPVGTPPTYKVTITNPGNQSTPINTAARVQVAASDSAGSALSYRANLPAGLSINSGNGLISGTPTASGSTPVTVTVTDPAGAYASASFTWTVTGAPAPPPPREQGHGGLRGEPVEPAPRRAHAQDLGH